MNIDYTDRGFEVIHFEDRAGHPCSLQQCSSIGDYGDAMERPGTSAVWIGSDDAMPRVMARDATKLGRPELIEGIEVYNGNPVGWVDWDIPPEVSMRTRANLTREQVRELIAHLQAWLDTGSFVLGQDRKEQSVSE